MFRDEAQISTSWLDSGCFGLEFVAGEVEVYLLVAEVEGVAVLPISHPMFRDLPTLGSDSW